MLLEIQIVYMDLIILLIFYLENFSLILCYLFCRFLNAI